MNIDQIIEKITKFDNCNVFQSIGIPVVPEGMMLPPDLIRFYELCGGIELFKDMDYSIEIVSPKDFVPTSPLIWDEVTLNQYAELFEVKITNSWYRIVNLGDSNFIAIDLNFNKSGRCYKAFWDSYAVRKETPIIANTFTELLNRLIDNNGEYWYFMQDDFESYGDVYAGEE